MMPSPIGHIWIKVFGLHLTAHSPQSHVWRQARCLKIKIRSGEIKGSVNQPILDNHLRQSQTTIFEDLIHLSSTFVDNNIRLSQTTTLDYHRQTFLHYLTLIGYLRQLSKQQYQNILYNYFRLSFTTTCHYSRLYQTMLDNSIRFSYTAILDKYIRLSWADYSRQLSQTSIFDYLGKKSLTFLDNHLRQLFNTLLDNL